MRTRTGLSYPPLQPTTFSSGNRKRKLHVAADRPFCRKRNKHSSDIKTPISDLFDSLPDDLVITILSNLCSAASSPSDFINILLTCKRLNNLGLNPMVLSRASQKTFAIRAKNWTESAHRFLKQCSDAGNVEACYTLGMIRFYCLQNRGSGASLMAKAAICSHAPALYSLAVIQFNGSGGSKNDKDLRAGVALCARAAFLGHIDALRELGHCLQDGYGVRQNITEGRRFLVQANARELAAVLSSEAASSVAASRSCLTWNTHPPHHRHVTGSGCPQAGGTIVMDADATTALRKQGVASTDDKFKFIWFKVCERLTSVLQNKMSNYDTDVFMPIFDAIQKATGARPYSGKVGPDDVDNMDMAYRVVADHIRTLSFAIADGSCPGNEGREYVLRRILRRAVRYGSEVLKAQEGFFNGLVSIVVKVMGDVFPELKQHELRIREIIAEEEASFGKTLLKGIEKFKKAAQDVQGKILSGQDAFILWDTYGFPLDLTQLMAEERGLLVDTQGFNNAMDEARERSRSAQNKQAGGTIAMDADATAALRKQGVASTDDKFKFIWFKDHESVVKAIYTGYEFLESVPAGNEVGLVLESTSFYAEQGGQIFDTGILEGSFGSFQVCNVQIFGGFIVHIGSFNGGSSRISLGDKVICKVDYERRTLIAPNHTCTHMLNFALREILGNHVDQKGSIVLPEKLRFDFSHGKPVDPDDLRKIESIVNKQIEDELDVNAKEVTLAEAKRINGLRAVFGEVYPDPVRVVAIGKNVDELLADPDNENWLSISSELCGGTHISNTREAKAFALLSEEGIAKGIRRITAVTTDSAFKAIEQAQSLEQEVDAAFNIDGNLLEKVVASFKNRVDSAPIPAARKAQIRAKIVLLQNEVRKAQKKLAEENMQKAVKIAVETAEMASSEGKAFCISHVDVGLDAAAVREAVVRVMEQKGISAMVFSTDETTKKAVVCAGVPPKGNQGKQLEVSEWLTTALQPLKGRCGKGKGGLATGQGTDASQIKEAMDLATSFASLKLDQ